MYPGASFLYSKFSYTLFHMPIHKKKTAELVQERPAPAQLSNLPRTPISVVVDNVRSLDNVGLIFRLCELARVDKLYLTGYTGHPRIPEDDREEGLIARHQSRILKTAVYAVPFQPWAYVEDPVPLVASLKEQGAQIVALEQTKQSIAHTTANYTLPTVLIVGHEREGVRQELLELADTLIEIPILGHGNSHNVATATGIVLYDMLAKTGKI
jgi:tRNA G18 (ribose-2'-O)-methylase SpoU